MSFACDRWKRIEDNIHAIALTIDSLRRIERAGSSDLLERAFTGFMALPPAINWRDVLGIANGAGPDEIRKAYRIKAKERHPDVPGGSEAAMRELTEAFQAALRELEASDNGK